MRLWRRLYAIEGKMYIIFGSEFIQCFSPGFRNFPVMRWSEAGDLLKLRRQMMYTTEAGLIGYFCKGKLFVNQELLYFFHSL